VAAAGGAGGEGGVRRDPLLLEGRTPRPADLVPRALSASGPAFCTAPSENPRATSAP
jgi:hypothetical protein